MKMSPHAYFHPNNSNDKPFSVLPASVYELFGGIWYGWLS